MLKAKTKGLVPPMVMKIMKSTHNRMCHILRNTLLAMVVEAILSKNLFVGHNKCKNCLVCFRPDS